MVVSSEAPTWPPETRLPTSTFRSEMRPSIGESTDVHSRLSSALRSMASADCNCALAASWLAFRWSKSRCVRTFDGVSCSALKVIARYRDLRSRPSDLRARCLHRNLERSGIDGKKYIPRLHGLAVREMDFHQFPGDARAYFDPPHGLELTGVFIPLNDSFQNWICDHDLRCFRLRVQWQATAKNQH